MAYRSDAWDGVFFFCVVVLFCFVHMSVLGVGRENGTGMDIQGERRDKRGQAWRGVFFAAGWCRRAT
jgi:hypothetical protein